MVRVLYIDVRLRCCSATLVVEGRLDQHIMILNSMSPSSIKPFHVKQEAKNESVDELVRVCGSLSV